MMKKELINIFPLTLYKSSIEISESEKKILIDEVYSMEKERVTEKRTDSSSSWTGDVEGHEFLFNNKKFKEDRVENIDGWQELYIDGIETLPGVQSAKVYITRGVNDSGLFAYFFDDVFFKAVTD